MKGRTFPPRQLPEVTERAVLRHNNATYCGLMASHLASCKTCEVYARSYCDTGQALRNLVNGTAGALDLRQKVNQLAEKTRMPFS